MNAFSKKNVQTTMFGIGSILTGIGSFLTAVFDNDVATEPNWTAIISAVILGIGLIRAQDAAKKE